MNCPKCGSDQCCVNDGAAVHRICPICLYCTVCGWLDVDVQLGVPWYRRVWDVIDGAFGPMWAWTKDNILLLVGVVSAAIAVLLTLAVLIGGT